MNSFQEIANFIWSIADEILRDDFTHDTARTCRAGIREEIMCCRKGSANRTALISAAVTGKIDVRARRAAAARIDKGSQVDEH